MSDAEQIKRMIDLMERGLWVDRAKLEVLYYWHMNGPLAPLTFPG